MKLCPGIVILCHVRLIKLFNILVDTLQTFQGTATRLVEPPSIPHTLKHLHTHDVSTEQQHLMIAEVIDGIGSGQCTVIVHALVAYVGHTVEGTCLSVGICACCLKRSLCSIPATVYIGIAHRVCLHTEGIHLCPHLPRHPHARAERQQHTDYKYEPTDKLLSINY